MHAYQNGSAKRMQVAFDFVTTAQLSQARQLVEDKVRHAFWNVITPAGALCRIIIEQDMRMRSRNCDEGELNLVHRESLDQLRDYLRFDMFQRFKDVKND